MIVKCPSCYKKIGPYDRSCPCGWSISESIAPPAHNCGWPACSGNAIASVQSSGKRVNLCPAHYDEYHRRQGIASAKSKGLSTAKDCRAWLAQRGIKVFKPMSEVGNETD